MPRTSSRLFALACQRRFWEAELLLESDVLEIDTPTSDGQTTLEWALSPRHGAPDFAALLLCKGAAIPQRRAREILGLAQEACNTFNVKAIAGVLSENRSLARCFQVLYTHCVSACSEQKDEIANDFVQKSPAFIVELSSWRFAGGSGGRRRQGVRGGQGALADELPIVGEDDEYSQGGVDHRRAAEQVAVQYSQNTASGTGNSGAAREGVRGLAHPGELRAPGLAVDGEEDEDVADVDALVGRAVVLGQQVEGVVIDGAGEGGVRGRVGPGGAFAAAVEQSGNDTSVGKDGVSMRKRARGESTYGSKPPSCGSARATRTVFGPAPASRSQPSRLTPWNDSWFGQTLAVMRRRSHIGVEGGEQERQAGALVVNAKQLWVQIIDKGGRVEGEKCAGL
ncbi:hypothetical protein PG989_000143 [Apiospora arundinis]